MSLTKIQRMGIAAAVAPLMRGTLPRKLRTESGREITTNELVQAQLKRMEVEAELTADEMKKYCVVCGTRRTDGSIYQSKKLGRVLPGLCRSCPGRAKMLERTPLQRSATRTKAWASMSPEQRSEKAKKGWNAVSQEKRREIAIKASHSRTPEQRRIIGKSGGVASAKAKQTRHVLD